MIYVIQGDLMIIYPKPYSIYIRGTINVAVPIVLWFRNIRGTSWKCPNNQAYRIWGFDIGVPLFMETTVFGDVSQDPLNPKP